MIEKKLDFWANHIDELKLLWNNADTTAASVKKRYFSGKKYLGSKDKKVIGGCFYFYLRTLNHTESLDALQLIALAYVNVEEVKINIDKLFKIDDFIPLLSSQVTNVDKLISDFDSKKVQSFFPETYISNILIDSSQMEGLCIALNSEATTDIRVIANRDMIEEELNASDIPFYTNMLEDCIKLEQNINFNTLISYKNGYFDVQDEGSQLVAHLVNPQPDETILDYCSGGGGKTIHIAELSEDNAYITATDIDLKRLKETERRVSFHRLSSVRILDIQDVDSSAAKYDKVLVDAPCSGSGTVRRAPEIRYSITEEVIKHYSDLQLEILNKCYGKLRSGGELIYSTCTFFAKENDSVIAKFLSEHSDLSTIDIKNRIIGLQLDPNKFEFTDSGVLTLTHKTKTDGFYVSLIQKS